MDCPRCNKQMRRINPEPESWIHWTPLYWCAGCHHFSDNHVKADAAEKSAVATAGYPAGGA